MGKLYSIFLYSTHPKQATQESDITGGKGKVEIKSFHYNGSLCDIDYMGELLIIMDITFNDYLLLPL